jgi:ubiquitin-protein ligase
VTGIRVKRLESDAERLRILASESGGSIVLKGTRGTPPEEYSLEYNCRGIARIESDRPVFRDSHSVSVRLPAVYPSPAGKPEVRVLTPVWHPHIFTSGVVCLGTWLISEHLDQLALRIGALLQFDPAYFDFRSPANLEAAVWAQHHMSLFPTGRVSFKAKRPNKDTAWGWKEL